MSAFEISLSQFMCVLLHRMIWENRMAVVVVLTDGGEEESRFWQWQDGADEQSCSSVPGLRERVNFPSLSSDEWRVAGWCIVCEYKSEQSCTAVCLGILKISLTLQVL